MGGDTTSPARDDNLYISIDLNGTPSSINFSPKKKVIGIQVQQIMDRDYQMHIIQIIQILNHFVQNIPDVLIHKMIKYVTDNDLLDG